MNRMRTRIKTNVDAGFTLIELLIVIVILGVLAGIAIFAADAFQTDAETACQDANERIDATVDAAEAAGGSGDYTSVDGDC